MSSLSLAHKKYFSPEGTEKLIRDKNRAIKFFIKGKTIETKEIFHENFLGFYENFLDLN
jgi:hypothetical protein